MSHAEGKKARKKDKEITKREKPEIISSEEMRKHKSKGSIDFNQ